MPHGDRVRGEGRILPFRFILPSVSFRPFSRLLPFLRSRLPTLLLWDAGLLAGVGVLVLSPGVGWQRGEALYALLLNLAAQGIWLAVEAIKRDRLYRRLRSDTICDEELCYSDEDLILAEIRSWKHRMEKNLTEEREKHQDYGDYLTGWVHELKTPLTVLRLGLTAMHEERLDGAQLGGVQLDGAQLGGAQPGGGTLGATELLDEVDRIGFLLDKALFYARSQSFSSDYLAKSVELPVLVRQVLVRNAHQCILRQLRPHFGPGFIQAEQAPERWRIVSDTVWLGFILQQVLANSLTYAPAGSELRFDLEPVDGWVRLYLDDQGPGVPAEEQVRIFDRGFTGQNRDRRGTKATSTGIGLYLVKKLADQLGHEVWAETPPRRPGSNPGTTPGTAPSPTSGPGLRIVLGFKGTRI